MLFLLFLRMYVVSGHGWNPLREAHMSVFRSRSVNHGLTLLQSREYKCPCQDFGASDRDGKPA
jgi:hypothetical protein